jgi:ATP-dependent RNA helicase DeaD
VFTFDSLGLSEAIVRALTDLNITKPTEIQERSIPILLTDGVDFIGLAQTGTGKTAAFGIPLIEHISSAPSRKVQALVLAPTRELALQIADAFKDFSKYHSDIRVQTVYGGTPIMKQIRDVKQGSPNVLIATPGRLIDLMERKVVDLSNVEFVVLDEADEMLNMGFQEDIETILSTMPEERSTWLFSATMPSEIRRLTKKYMREPQEVSVISKEHVNTNITHQFLIVKRPQRNSVLQYILDSSEDFYGVVFTKTKMDAQEVADGLMTMGYPAEALHGDMSQSQREAVMKRFRASNTRILIATDVAARGIDVENLTHVIHYALPEDKSSYTHRSGRTGRAGKKGLSISLVQPSEERKLKMLRSSLKIEIEPMSLPSREELLEMRLDKIKTELFSNVVENDPAFDRFKTRMIMEDQGDLLEILLYKEFKKVLKKLPVNELKLDNSRDRGDRGGDRDRDRDRGGDRGGRKDRKDFSQRPGKRDRDRDRGNSRTAEAGKQRFFVNVGRMDEASKGDLIRLICDMGKIQGADIGRIELGNKGSVVELDTKVGSKVQRAIDGKNVNGRRLKFYPDQM